MKTHKHIRSVEVSIDETDGENFNAIAKCGDCGREFMYNSNVIGAKWKCPVCGNYELVDGDKKMAGGGKMLSETETTNRLFAEFMGVELYNTPFSGFGGKINGEFYKLKDFKYHSSWDWLIPVVLEIASINPNHPVCKLWLTTPRRAVWRECRDSIIIMNRNKLKMEDGGNTSGWWENNQKEINSGNALIAEFMGYIKSSSDKDFEFYKHPDGKGIVTQSTHDYKRFDTHGLMEIRGFLFHRDWNWLIPVVEKIEKTRLTNKGGAAVMITGTICQIPLIGIGSVKPIKIEAVWDAVVQFMKWFNDTKNK